MITSKFYDKVSRAKNQWKIKKMSSSKVNITKMNGKLLMSCKRANTVPTGFNCPQHHSFASVKVEDPEIEPYIIEFGKFRRSSGLQLECLQAMDVMNKEAAALAQERDEIAGYLSPDKLQFNGLEFVEEWPKSDLVPVGANLTVEVKKRVKKGMLNGMLYNISLLTVKEIFDKLTEVDWEPTIQGTYEPLVRCPLCPKEDKSKIIYHHIECFHTSSFAQCTDCSRVFMTFLTLSEHIPFCNPMQMARCSVAQVKDFNSSVTEYDGANFNEVRWIHNWRTRIDLFCQAITDYEETDHESSTDSERGDEEIHWQRETNYYSKFYKENVGDRKRKKPCFNQNIVDEYDKLYFFNSTVRICNDDTFFNTLIDASKFNQSAKLVSAQVRFNREIAVEHISPDPRIFSDLDDVKSWDESQIPPPKRRLSESARKSILKGMSMGKQYNIGFDLLNQVFPLIPPEEETRKIRCPLCSKSYKSRTNTLRHLESVHTRFTAICIKCERQFATTRTVYRHDCARPCTKYEKSDSSMENEDDNLKGYR